MDARSWRGDLTLFSVRLYDACLRLADRAVRTRSPPLGRDAESPWP